MTSSSELDQVLHLNLEFARETSRASVSVPNRSMPVTDLLPVIQDFEDGLTELAARASTRQGKSISCRAGCTACCHYLVGVSESEADYLAELVAQVPEERRTRIRERFQLVIEELEQCGLLDQMGNLAELSDEALDELSHKYLARWIPCPFLQDDRCSIYEHRPLTCREHLVTSPAENCSDLAGKDVERVPLPTSASHVLHRFADGKGDARPRIVALVLALQYAEQHKDEPAPQYSAPQMFRNFFLRAVRLSH